MAVLPYNDIDTRLVGNAIGLGSDDIGQLFVRAKSGGIPGTDINGQQYTSAFSTLETGSFAEDGKLLYKADDFSPTAYPYWNIYSANSPGYWIPYGKFGMVFQLNRDSAYKYRFDLGDFRGYNHDAEYPSITDVVVSGLNGSTHRAKLACRLGGYDWRKFLGATHYCMSEINGLGQTVKSTSLKKLEEPGMNGVLEYKEVLMTSSYYNRLAIELTNSIGDTVAFLPVYGKIEYKVTKHTVGYLGVSSPSGGGSSLAISPIHGNSGISAGVRRSPNASGGGDLKEIRYTGRVNGVIVYEKTRTSGFNPIRETTSFQWNDVGVGSLLRFDCLFPEDIWGTIPPEDASVDVDMIFR